MPTETEIKIAIASLDAVEARLTGLGFTIKHERVFEINVLYDTADEKLRGQGALLRVRTIGDHGVLTYKGRSENGKHKSREEIETELGNPQHMADILGKLGLAPKFRYEKYRIEYTDSIGTLTLDETPIGNYLELEGQADWIDSMALKLGFTQSDYVTKSYGALYLDHCSAQGILPSNMVF